MPRSAVSGVRSSCEASPTKRRSGSRARSSEASIAFRVSRQLADLAGRPGAGSRSRGVAGAPISRAPVESRVSGRSARRGSGGEQRGERGGDERGEQDEPPASAARVSRESAVVPATMTAPPAAWPRQLAQRRGVEAEGVGAEPGVAVAGAAVLERGPRHAGQRAARARRARPSGRRAARGGRRPARAAAPAEAALQRAGLGQQLRRGGGEPRDVDRAVAQRLVERVLELASSSARTAGPSARRRRRSPPRPPPRPASAARAASSRRGGSRRRAPCGSGAGRRACGAGRRRSGRRRWRPPPPPRPTPPPARARA